MATDDYLFLFGDLIGSTEVASEASPPIYSKLYGGSFHLAIKCAREYLGRKDIFPDFTFLKTLENIKIAGDEVFSFHNISELTKEEKIDLIASAVSFAFVLKVFWMAAPYNLLRLSEKKFPRDISIGIHTGPAETITDDPNSDIGGLHINVAKRLENLGRSGSHSRILVSDDIAHNFGFWVSGKKHTDTRKAPPILYTCFEHVKSPLDLKGIPVKVTPFELIMDSNNEKVYELFKLIKETPKKDDARAEVAAGVLGETLFKNLEGMKFLQQIIGDVINPETYIDVWFSSINPIPRLFLNDLWTEMIAFFISCGFIRYNGITPQNRTAYEEIAESIYVKLLASLNQLKMQKK